LYKKHYLCDVVELDEDDGGEEEDGGGDEQEHVAQVQEPKHIDTLIHQRTATKIPFIYSFSGNSSPNFNIHESVSDLYSPRIGLHISSSRIGRLIVGNSSQTHECGN
jgi:hypothetical protein